MWPAQSWVQNEQFLFLFIDFAPSLHGQSCSFPAFFQFVLQMEAMTYWKWRCLGESVADAGSGEEWSCPGANLVFCSERPLCFVISSLGREGGREGWVFRGRNPIWVRNLLRLGGGWGGGGGDGKTLSPPEPSVFPAQRAHPKPITPNCCCLLVQLHPNLGRAFCPQCHSLGDNGPAPPARSPSTGR